MHCNFCGSDNYDIIFEYTRFIKNNILKCATCGLVYLETGQTTEELKSFYKKCKRVWLVLKKPTKQEFEQVAKISAIGIAILGFIGFIISMGMGFFAK